MQQHQHHRAGKSVAYFGRTSLTQAGNVLQLRSVPPLDHQADASRPIGLETCCRRPPSWLGDGAWVFVVTLLVIAVLA